MDSEKNKQETASLLENRLIAEQALTRKKEIEQKVEKALQFIRDFYKLGHEPFYADKYNPFLNLSKEAINKLNCQLQFESNNTTFIAKLFTDGNKQKFIDFLCSTDAIKINFSLVKIHGRPLIYHLIHSTSREDFHFYLVCIIKKGYQFSEKDHDIIQTVYNNYHLNYSESERECIRRWGLCKIIEKINSPYFAQQVIKHQKLLLAIASLKYNISITYSYPTLGQVTHFFLTTIKQHGQIYLQAMRAFDQMEVQLKADKSGKLRKKIAAFEASPPTQDQSLDHLIYHIFPEIRTIYKDLPNSFSGY